MNPFDAHIIHFINQFAQKSPEFDHLMEAIQVNELLKGGFIVSILWWAWFRGGETKERDRQVVISALIVSTVALLAARFLALVLPFRERPLRTPGLGFHPPYGVDNTFMINWSSFPSDHAVLFFSLATAIWCLSHKAGILAYFDAIFIVSLPRLYTGLHFPTDVLAGAAIGILFGLLSADERVREFLAKRPILWMEQSPSTFYPCFFLVTFLLGTNFDPLRSILGPAWRVSRVVLHHHL